MLSRAATQVRSRCLLLFNGGTPRECRRRASLVFSVPDAKCFVPASTCGGGSGGGS